MERVNFDWSAIDFHTFFFVLLCKFIAYENSGRNKKQLQQCVSESAG
jgi:hypothetical protein